MLVRGVAYLLTNSIKRRCEDCGRVLELKTVKDNSTSAPPQHWGLRYFIVSNNPPIYVFFTDRYRISASGATHLLFPSIAIIFIGLIRLLGPLR